MAPRSGFVDMAGTSGALNQPSFITLRATLSNNEPQVVPHIGFEPIL